MSPLGRFLPLTFATKVWFHSRSVPSASTVGSIQSWEGTETTMARLASSSIRFMMAGGIAA